MRRAVSIVITVMTLALAWWFVVPSGLGGRTTYVTTHGISMQPRFHTGDLAILHRSSSYHVGEVVAYHSKTLRTVVMHRLIAGNERTGFTVRGDNNAWDDPDHPTRADILGALSWRIPRGGSVLATLHSPRVYIPGGLAVAGALTAGASGGRRRRRRRSAPTESTAVRPRPTGAATWRDDAVLMSAAVAAVLLVIAAWCWTRPTTVTASSTVSAAQRGDFTYSADVPRSIAYPAGELRTGDPIYPRLVHRLRIDYAYGDGLATTGTLRLRASLSAASGWSRNLAATSSVVRRGAAHATVAVDLAAVFTQLRQLAGETGTPVDSATLSIVATVSGTGEIQSQPTPVTTSATLGWATSPTAMTQTAASHLHTDTAAHLTVSVLRPSTLHLGAWVLPVRRARLTSAGTLGLAVLWLAASYAIARKQRDPHTEALRRYGERIVEVTHLPLDGTTPVVDVASLAGLHSIAVRYEAAVLHTTYAGQDYYAVRDGETWFCYRTVAAAAPPRLSVVRRSA